MLHIRQAPSVTARWSLQGWPALVGWTEHPDLPALYWALHEIGPASTAGDFAALDDLLAEASLWLDRILLGPEHGGPVGRPDLGPVLTLLWGELQMGRGAGDVVQMGVNASLMRRVVTPPAAAARTADVVPPYVPIARRVEGGHLPLVADQPVTAAGRPAHERFLLALAAVLSNGGGHLVDHDVVSYPRGASPSRTGWGPDGRAPLGELLGSVQIQPDGRGTLLLRPAACVRAVNAAEPTVGWDAGQVGQGLARAWLVDTTLIVDVPQVQRVATAAAAVTRDGDAEPLWLLPLRVFHPAQFLPSAGPGRSSRGGLRAVPDQ